MNMISTKKLLISLIIVMGIMMLGIVNQVDARTWKGDKVNITMNPETKKGPYSPADWATDKIDSSSITKFNLYQLDSSNNTTELKGSYKNGVTSFESGAIKLSTMKIGNEHKFYIEISDKIQIDKFRIEVFYKYLHDYLL